MELNEITSKIIGSAMTVHRKLGPGLLESIYHKCLLIQLRKDGLAAESEVMVPVVYDGEDVSDDKLRIDVLVEGDVIVELKSVEEINPIHKKQLLTYLRLKDKALGLLINFNEMQLKDGITRIVNNYSGDSE